MLLALIICRRPASDIRRFVASTSFDNLPKSISGSNLAGFVADVRITRIAVHIIGIVMLKKEPKVI